MRKILPLSLVLQKCIFLLLVASPIVSQKKLQFFCSCKFLLSCKLELKPYWRVLKQNLSFV